MYNDGLQRTAAFRMKSEHEPLVSNSQHSEICTDMSLDLTGDLEGVGNFCHLITGTVHLMPHLILISSAFW
jgi:hypothetical protein